MAMPPSPTGRHVAPQKGRNQSSHSMPDTRSAPYSCAPVLLAPGRLRVTTGLVGCQQQPYPEFAGSLSKAYRTCSARKWNWERRGFLPDGPVTATAGTNKEPVALWL
mmetsp:Transcript_32670/g.92681  ORF Transcript_32670/g.92681 Transcript_32670/m.92681 type:complete len:107 (+) Transcript_32670:527-847(+)